MTHTSSFDWFRLAQTRGIGVKFLWDVYDFVSKESRSLSDLLSDLLIGDKIDTTSLPTKLRKKLSSSIINQDYEALRKAFEHLEENKVKILDVESPHFPERLKRYGRKYGIPPLLYARGYVPLANSNSQEVNSIAIVGSRNIGEEALSITSKLAKELAREGFNIVSGYAKGVDSTAHLGALEVEGTTTIVLGLGILNFEVKKDFKPLFSRYNTLVLSQFNPTDKWLARNAMARNKLVCALSDAVIVIASGQEIDNQGRMSGTFDTAKSALEMNIPVFVLSPQCFNQPPVGNTDLIQLGCHEILPQNAIQEILSRLKRESIDIDKQKASSTSNRKLTSTDKQEETTQLKLPLS
ncbi:DNA-processing protein DprA [Thermosynechococcaceae cyanobacterium Okahandja]